MKFRFEFLAWVILVAIGMNALLSTPVFAGINCAKNLSPTEVIICKDPWLQKLDRRMNVAYDKAIEVALDKQAFIRDQQQWLRETRDRCGDSNCINLAYLPRIERLKFSYELNKDLHLAITQGINESDISRQESKEICTNLAKMAADGRIGNLFIHGFEQGNLDSQNIEDGWVFTDEDRNAIRARKSLFVYGEDVKVIYKLKLTKNGAPVRFATFYNWGAEQPLWRIFNLSIVSNPEDKDNGIDEVVGLGVDETMWARELDRPIFFHGRYFIFSTSDVASMVSWIRPNGRIRPLCFWEKGGKIVP